MRVHSEFEVTCVVCGGLIVTQSSQAVCPHCKSIVKLCWLPVSPPREAAEVRRA